MASLKPQRLARYGLTLSGGALAAALSEGAAAAVPAALAVTTVQAAAGVAACPGAAVVTPAAVLMKEVLQDMLMTKLKLGVVVTLAGVLLGGGLAYRAAGQAPAPERQAQARPLTDLEILRREVEILKLQVEVMQEKFRAQEAEMRALKDQFGGAGLPPGMMRGQAGGRMQGPGAAGLPSGADPLRLPDDKPGQPPGFRLTPPEGRLMREPSGFPPAPPTEGGGRPADKPVPDLRPSMKGNMPSGVSPEHEVETALKAFREAPDDKTRQRAAEALEKAVKKLRQRPNPAGQGPKDQPPENVEGLIKATDPGGLVTITIGSDAGLAKGNTLEVFRLAGVTSQSKYLGTIRILTVTPSEAVGELVNRPSAPLQKGDIVASRIQ